MGERAIRLAADLKADTLSGVARVLADEAVLIVERLEQLDKILQGEPDAWLGIVERLPAEVAEVVINAPLAEARQQAVALKALLAELGKVLGQTPAMPELGRIDELGKKREARLAGNA